jgi:PhnB protein
MQINPYLFFDGDCREALEFYAAVLNGRIEAMLTYRETPGGPNVGEDWRDKILHARLAIGDSIILASDSPPSFGPVKPSGFYVSLSLPTTEEGERAFNALAEGGEVRMPFAQTFWARGFGMLVDRFQTPWMINCD